MLDLSGRRPCQSAAAVALERRRARPPAVSVAPRLPVRRRRRAAPAIVPLLVSRRRRTRTAVALQDLEYAARVVYRQGHCFRRSKASDVRDQLPVTYEEGWDRRVPLKMEAHTALLPGGDEITQQLPSRRDGIDPAMALSRYGCVRLTCAVVLLPVFHGI